MEFHQFNKGDKTQEERNRFYEDDDTSVHLEKLNSYEFTIYKYCMLLSALWSVKDIFKYLFDFPQEGDESKSLMLSILFYCGDMMLLIWNIINCGLVFEGIRRKSLDLMVKVIDLMEAYCVISLIVQFFIGSSTRLKKDSLEGTPENNKFKDFVLEDSQWTLFVAFVLIVWAIYYHFVYLYGARKVKDLLKAHTKAKYSF